MKLVSNSPAALEGYLSLNNALGKGSLKPKTRERIALAIAEINGCSYRLSAHTYLGKNVAKLDDAEIAANRNGNSSAPKAAAAVKFSTRVALERGHVSDADLAAVKAAQIRYGSRETNSRFELADDTGFGMTKQEAEFIGERDSFYQATVLKSAGLMSSIGADLKAF